MSTHGRTDLLVVVVSLLDGADDQEGQGERGQHEDPACELGI